MEANRTVETIQNWRKSVDRKMFDFEGNPSMVMEPDRSYGKMRGLLLVQVAADYSANFYFDQAGKCVLVYVTDPEVLLGMEVQAIEAHFGEPDLVLASRAGAQHRHHVYAYEGFAFSERGGEIRFFETFSPMTADGYLGEVYAGVGG